jgi:uncharacterized protein YkwD
MRCLVNWTRRHGGRSTLRQSPELDCSAGLRADDIRRCQDFSHSPCGEPFITVFQQVGFLNAAGTVAENLAWGQGRLGSARTAMASWLSSSEQASDPVRRKLA